MPGYGVRQVPPVRWHFVQRIRENTILGQLTIQVDDRWEGPFLSQCPAPRFHIKGDKWQTNSWELLPLSFRSFLVENEIGSFQPFV